MPATPRHARHPPSWPAKTGHPRLLFMRAPKSWTAGLRHDDRVPSLPASHMTALLPLFLVSLTALGCEIALTRYFAVAKWSEYGYWVISIVMVGFALSGVVLALWRNALTRRGNRLLAVLPALLIATGALGYHATTINPFNPLQLQNQATWLPQFGYIA